MKKLKFVPAIILSLTVLGSGFSVCATDKEYDVDTEVEVHEGYSIISGQSAVSFDSFDDYAEYSLSARRELGEGGIYPINYYFENYDYIYVPTFLKDKTEDISCIFISPGSCRVTYKLDDKELDTYHYFLSDNKESCTEYQTASDSSGKTVVGSTEYHITTGFGNKPETLASKAYCCRWDNSFFEFDFQLGIENMGDEPFVKVYIDKHLQEKDGSLYYISDENEPQSGWKTVNGHKYFFRSSDKTAVCGKNAKIGGIVYSFNANGICMGKYTGYALDKDGARIYLKDGRKEQQERSPVVMISVYESRAYDDFDQYVYVLDSDGLYYNYHTYDEMKGIDIKEDNWYDKILEIDPIKKDEYYVRVNEGAMKTAIDFSKHLADYKDHPVKEYYDLEEYDSGILSVYGIYYDKDGIPQYVKLCSYGEQAECIDSKDVIDFVNKMSFTNDMGYIFYGGFQIKFPY